MIEDEKVAIRAIDILEKICHLCKLYQSLPKSKQASSKSYVTLILAKLPIQEDRDTIFVSLM